MKDFMQSVPLAIVRVEDIGFAGGLELSKIIINKNLVSYLLSII